MVDEQDVRLCQQCSRPLAEHDRHVRFQRPDPVLDAPDQERSPDTWMSSETPGTSVMLQVPHVGAFVRCLLPVSLSGGYAVTFGVWVAVHPDDLQRAAGVWDAPEYAELALDGWLANRLPGWDCLAAPVHAEVQHPDHTPYVVSSTDPDLARVLTEEWPHETVLSALP